MEDENGAVQYTNLISYDDDQKSWIVSPEIEYQVSLSYSYTILTGVPEAVTYKSDDTGKLFDCHVDWETAHANWTLYRNKVLEIVNGAGALKGFSSKIDAPNKNGYWVLSRDFPHAPPVGTATESWVRRTTTATPRAETTRKARCTRPRRRSRPFWKATRSRSAKRGTPKGDAPRSAIL